MRDVPSVGAHSCGAHPRTAETEQGGRLVIIDHRTYSLYPLMLQRWLDLYEKEGLPVQQRHLGALIGFFVTEIGPLHQAVHLWSYDSMEDRQQRRAKVAADPDWTAFLKKNSELGAMQAQENKILVPVRFSPIK